MPKKWTEDSVVFVNKNKDGVEFQIWEGIWNGESPNSIGVIWSNYNKRTGKILIPLSFNVLCFFIKHYFKVKLIKLLKFLQIKK